MECLLGGVLATRLPSYLAPKHIEYGTFLPTLRRPKFVVCSEAGALFHHFPSASLSPEAARVASAAIVPGLLPALSMLLLLWALPAVALLILQPHAN